MKLYLYNSLTREKEIFTPLQNNMVRMYVCGPTVYDIPHIGNARSIVIYDLLYRILRRIFTPQAVIYIRNITDIDDKIIDRAALEGTSILPLTERITKIFHDQTRYLFCLPPTFEPKATQHISDMIMIIEKLIKKEIAYEKEGHVYFNVSKYKDYTSLSGRDLNESMEDTRDLIDNVKNNPHDFVLWKPALEEDESSFDSPFGRGRPGWHIECSAMSYKYLGDSFDIHGGGSDLIFPHHTNEIAQSRCAFPDSIFAKYWVHNGFLTVNGQKMSKSLGNFITIENIMNNNIQGEVIKLVLLSTHYRKPLDYTEKSLNDAQKILDYWQRAIKSVNDDIVPQDEYITNEFIESLHDDMNSVLAIKILNEYAKNIFISTDLHIKIINAQQLVSCANMMGFLNIKPDPWFKHNITNHDLIENLIQQRTDAKMQKNWEIADNIRSQLLQMGIVIEDNADNITTWKNYK